ncbi:MAG: hypothetical protein methR_P3940 [Methyloprofundus sp.]|nr:MAG: hypothetical protein methR_P3940 [Methyloprofundus sp.]
MADKNITPIVNIQDRIFIVRDVQVIIDSDLAEMYGVETKNLNRAVNRNKERFPDKFRFQLTQIEFDEYEKSLRFPFGTSKKDDSLSLQIETSKEKRGGRRYLPFVFTEQGIFYDGQVFDAYVFIAKLIKSAKKSIVLIDNYVDESTLQLFSKREQNVRVTIYTQKITAVLKQDLEKHNSQYSTIDIIKFTKAHDRFLIIDETSVYHFGASLKDLGKKWFAFSKMEMQAMEMIAEIGNRA